jgi:hypothetical protein
MRATELLGREIKGVERLLHELVDDATPREWVTAAAPGTNPLGFNVWHVARTQDWILRSIILGEPELIAEPRFASLAWSARHGIGSDMGEAAIADLVHRSDRDSVLAYADAVNDALRAWLRSQTDDDLDAIPPFAERQNAIPAYATDAHWAATGHLDGNPVWRLLVGPARSHARDHIAEARVLLQVLRGR